MTFMNKETHQRFIDLACELDEAMEPHTEEFTYIGPERAQRIEAASAAFEAAAKAQRKNEEVSD